MPSSSRFPTVWEGLLSISSRVHRCYKGILAGLVWKSFETVSQVSLRNQVLVFGDMLRSKVFGRDLSRV